MSYEKVMERKWKRHKDLQKYFAPYSTKQAEEFKIKLDGLSCSAENEAALNMARYALLRSAIWSLMDEEEIPSLEEVVSGKIKIRDISTKKILALKEALAGNNGTK